MKMWRTFLIGHAIIYFGVGVFGELASLNLIQDPQLFFCGYALLAASLASLYGGVACVATAVCGIYTKDTPE